MRYPIFIFLFLVFITPAFSQDLSKREEALELALAREELRQIYTEDTQQKEKSEEKVWQYSQNINSFFRYIPKSKVESQAGKIEAMEAGIEYSYAFKAFGKLPLKLSLGNDYIAIDNSSSVKLPSHLVLDATFPCFSLENTYFRLGLRPAMLRDDWDFETSSFRIPFYTVLIRQLNDKLMFLVGVAVAFDFEQEVMPVLGLVYKPNARLSFNLIPEEPNISYQLNEKVTLLAEGGISSGEFEVDKDNLSNVVLMYKEMRLGIAAKIKITPNVEASFGVGRTFQRSIKYRDTNLGKLSIEPSVYSQVRLEIKL